MAGEPTRERGRRREERKERGVVGPTAFLVLKHTLADMWVPYFFFDKCHVGTKSA